jgi:hypothetical protein
MSRPVLRGFFWAIFLWMELAFDYLEQNKFHAIIGQGGYHLQNEVGFLIHNVWLPLARDWREKIRVAT